MTNIDTVGRENIPFPPGYHEIAEDYLVREGDKICAVSIERRGKHTVHWLSPDKTEIGKPKRFAGQIVLRKS